MVIGHKASITVNGVTYEFSRVENRYSEEDTPSGQLSYGGVRGDRKAHQRATLTVSGFARNPNRAKRRESKHKPKKGMRPFVPASQLNRWERKQR